MLDRLRGRLGSAMLKLGAGASRLIPSPTAWTLIGVAFAVLSACLYAFRGYPYELLAGLALLLSGFLDIVDGAVARSTNRTSRRGSFLDSTLDRLGEALVFTGIAVGGYSTAWAVVLALSLSLLVSYTRAKADSLGVSLAGVGVGERSERLLVLAVSSIVGLLPYGILLVILLAGATFAERVYRVSVALRGRPPP